MEEEDKLFSKRMSYYCNIIVNIVYNYIIIYYYIHNIYIYIYTCVYRDQISCKGEPLTQACMHRETTHISW